MDDNKKPIIRSPGSSTLLDGTRPVIYAGPAISTGVFGLLFCMGLGLMLTWWNIPFLPLPPSDKPALYHAYAFYAMWVGKFLPFLRFDTYHSYLNQIIRWSDQGQGAYLLVRWVFALLAGVAGGYGFLKLAWKPVHTERQVRGRPLLEGKEAFKDLFREFKAEVAAVKIAGLILSSSGGFDPNKPETYDDSKTLVIAYPDTQRRTHFLILGGSRRGKGVFNKQHVVQIDNLITAGERQKLFIVDTPKGEYASLIRPENMIQIAPDEKFSVSHWIGRDLALAQDAQKFWAGKIPENDKDPFWSNAARGIGAGICVFLQRETGEDWGYSQLAYWKDQSPEVLTPLLKTYYPEVSQILNMGAAPLGSVLGTLAGFTLDVNDLARVWDGYDYKHSIHQMSAAMLRREFWVKWFVETAYPQKLEIEGRMEVIPFNQCTNFLIFGLLSHLNELGVWKWVDLKEILLKPFDTQRKIAQEYLLPEQVTMIDRAYMQQHIEKVLPILQYAEIWDDYEARPKISIRDWVLDENPEKKIFLLKPSGRFKNQSEGIIRGILYYMTGIINDKYFPDDKSKKVPLRNFHIFLDEFQSLGNLKQFIEPGLEMFASKGITIYLSTQDFSQLKEIYGENFLNFLQGNTGNIFIMGTNQGASAEMISNLVGKNYKIKLHTSQSFQADGKSSSINYQEHEGVVITPAEINSKLGTRRTKAGKYVVHAMYLPGNMVNAYILTFPVNPYEIRYTPEAPDWMTGKLLPPAPITTKKAIDAMLGTGSGKKKLTDEQPVPDAADEIDDEVPDFEPSPEEEEAMARATQAQETKPLYRLPSEEVDMQGDLLKEGVTDLIGGHALTTLKQVADILDGSKSHLTTSKKKYLEEWDKVKESRNQSLELTKRK